MWANFDFFVRHHCAKELGCICFIISTSFAWDMFHVLSFCVLWSNFDIFGRHHCAKELGCTCFIISTSVQHKIKLLENLSVELALLKLIRFWMLFVGNCRDGITQNRFELLTELIYLHCRVAILKFLRFWMLSLANCGIKHR